MEPLFTTAESEKLYDESQPFEQDCASAAYIRAREEFVRKAEDVLSAFRTGGESPLFGTEETGFPSRLAFAPFYRYVKKRCSAVAWKDSFLSGAFSGWEQAFIVMLDRLFGTIALQVLEDEAGEMTFPSERWIKEKALPLIENGRHFRLLAEKYPLCARQLIEFTCREAEHALEVLEATAEELPGLWAGFFPGMERKRAASVSAGDSDRHNGGRSVHILTFEGGARLVYKPHSLKADRAFAAWVDMCAEKAGLEPFLFPRCEDTARGGFCAFMEHRPLTRREDAERFFYRTGFLIGLVYLMNGNDLHCENMIAVGNEPVLIDTETLVCPESSLRGRVNEKKERNSVEDMAVLPMLLCFPGLRQARYAGLCHAMPGSHNLPEFEGEQLTGRAYAEEISRGFEKAVTTVLDGLPEACRGFETLFTGVSARSVVRPTAAYDRILTGLCYEDCQSDLKRYRSLLERMRPVAEHISEGDRDLITREERAAFDRLDIPYFCETLTPGMLRGLTESWGSLTREDVRREGERLFFGLKETDPRTGAKERITAAEKPDCSRNKLLEGIRRQAHLLEELLPAGKAIPVVVPEEQDDYVVCKPLREVNGMLEGSLGVLCALSACCRVLGEEKHLLRERLRTLTEQLTDPVAVAPVLTGGELSLAAGTAGYILGCWLLLRMGTMTEEQFLRALKLADPIAEREERIKYSSFRALYGSYDMLYVLSVLPERYHTPALKKIRGYITEAAGTGKTETEILQSVRAEMICPAPASGPLRNNSLRFGNAGLLMLSMERPERDAAYEAALAGALASADSVLPGTPRPEGYLETGLFHGMPGVTYSLSRYLAPDAVPGV